MSRRGKNFNPTSGFSHNRGGNRGASRGGAQNAQPITGLHPVVNGQTHDATQRDLLGPPPQGVQLLNLAPVQNTKPLHGPPSVVKTESTLKKEEELRQKLKKLKDLQQSAAATASAAGQPQAQSQSTQAQSQSQPQPQSNVLSTPAGEGDKVMLRRVEAPIQKPSIQPPSSLKPVNPSRNQQDQASVQQKNVKNPQEMTLQPQAQAPSLSQPPPGGRNRESNNLAKAVTQTLQPTLSTEPVKSVVEHPVTPATAVKEPKKLVQPRGARADPSSQAVPGAGSEVPTASSLPASDTVIAPPRRVKLKSLSELGSPLAPLSTQSAVQPTQTSTPASTVSTSVSTSTPVSVQSSVPMTPIASEVTGGEAQGRKRKLIRNLDTVAPVDMTDSTTTASAKSSTNLTRQSSAAEKKNQDQEPPQKKKNTKETKETIQNQPQTQTQTQSQSQSQPQPQPQPQPEPQGKKSLRRIVKTLPDITQLSSVPSTDSSSSSQKPSTPLPAQGQEKEKEKPVIRKLPQNSNSNSAISETRPAVLKKALVATTVAAPETETETSQSTAETVTELDSFDVSTFDMMMSYSASPPLRLNLAAATEHTRAIAEFQRYIDSMKQYLKQHQQSTNRSSAIAQEAKNMVEQFKLSFPALFQESS